MTIHSEAQSNRHEEEPMLHARRLIDNELHLRRAIFVMAGVLMLAFTAVGAMHKGVVKAYGVSPQEPSSVSKADARHYATDFNWSLSSSDDLIIPGTKTISLPTCPSGVFGSEPWYYIYIGGKNAPEAVRVTGGTCKGNDQPGTLQFTTANPHPPGYTVGSASTGLQEASIATRYSYKDPPSRVSAGGRVIVPPAELNIYARVSIRASNQTIDFSGSVFNCYTDDSCIFVGDPRNSTLVSDVTLVNPKGQPMVVKGTKAMIETNGQKTRILNASARKNSSGGTFGTYIQVDDDQAFLLDGLDSGGGYGVRCDAEFCGSYITAPGPFNTWSAVGWLKNLQISNQCVGNGVDWQSGNTLHIEDSVIQGFAQFGVRTGTMRGGYGPTQLTNIYMEVGGCTNPQYPGKGAEARAMAGLINEGGIVTVTGDMYPVGQVPQFSGIGPTLVYYWIVVKDSAKGSSVPLPIGYTLTDGKAPVHVAWPKVKGTQTITYDLLKTTGGDSPWLAPVGAGQFAVSTGIGQCGEPICTAVDPNGVATNYALPSPMYHPKIDFWPGGIVLGPNIDSVNSGPTTVLFVNSTRFVTPVSPFVNIEGIAVPTVYASLCGPESLPNTWVTCVAGDSVGNNAVPAATVLQYGLAVGGDPVNRKGRLIFGRGPLTSVNRGHYITLVDSNPTKTLNTRGYRPANDKTDTYIGLDSPSVSTIQAQLAFGAPVSISDYIGNEGDGKGWGERLTAKQKTFAVPVVVQPGSSFTLGAGSPLSQLKIFRTEGVPKASVPAQRCLDLPARASGLTAADQITGITPPATLGNLSLNAYAQADNGLVLHFCNPSTSAVDVPAGAYSFLAVH
jgi:hypothetical protein